MDAWPPACTSGRSRVGSGPAEALSLRTRGGWTFSAGPGRFRARRVDGIGPLVALLAFALGGRPQEDGRGVARLEALVPEFLEPLGEVDTLRAALDAYDTREATG
jgi:hypothetical protein